MNTLILEAHYIKDLHTVCQQVPGVKLIKVIPAAKPEDWHQAQVESSLNKKELGKKILEFPFVWVKD